METNAASEPTLNVSGENSSRATWRVAREALGLFGILGLALLVFHAFGVEPSDLARGWFYGALWAAKHWETWVASICMTATVAAASAWSGRATLHRLWQLPCAAVIGCGAVRGAWMAEPLFGLLLGVLIGAPLVITWHAERE